MMAASDALSLPIRLLQLVSYGGIRSTAELGRRLGVSTGLVTLMAEDLRRRGYLEAVSGGECESGCASCGVASTCRVPGAQERLPLLVLTEKGKTLAPRR